MSIPLSYNLRNLMVNRTTTLMTAVGLGLTVAVLVGALALINGVGTTLAISGDPARVLLMRKGATSELVSNFEREQFQDLKFLPGIAPGWDGQPLASLEIVTVINLPNRQNPAGANVTVRGLAAAGIEMRRNVRLVAGRWFEFGRRELIVGSRAAQRFPDAGLGKTLHFAEADWDIVGVLEAKNGVPDSEIWGDLNQISAANDRPDVLSSAILQATDRTAAQALMNRINHDPRFSLDATFESDFYQQQTVQAAPIIFTGIFIAIIMAAGAGFAAMNTMYAAVSRRSRDIGTLRVLGFSRASILFSFLAESALLSALGGLLGCLLAMPFNGITTAIGGANFSELAFDLHVSPQIMGIGLAFAIAVGAIGGFLPARAASRREILAALRQA